MPHLSLGAHHSRIQSSFHGGELPFFVISKIEGSIRKFIALTDGLAYPVEGYSLKVYIAGVPPLAGGMEKAKGENQPPLLKWFVIAWNGLHK